MPTPAMPTPFHQRILALVRAQPSMVIELLIVVEPELREFLLGHRLVARARDTNLRAIGLSDADVDRLGDLVITVHPADDPDGTPTIAVVVECQLHPDPEKHYAWIDYLAAVRREHRSIGRVLVLSPVDSVIPWAHRLFDAEPWLRPKLIGREHMPRIDDHGRALREPYLAILSAVFHGPHERGAEVVSAAALALRVLPRYRQIECIALLECVLPEDMMQEIRNVTFEEAQAAADDWIRRGSAYQKGLRAGVAVGVAEGVAVGRREGVAVGRREGVAVGRREGIAEGRRKGIAEGRRKGIDEGRREGVAEGRREALALVLELRGLTPTPDQQARIDACTDLSTLARWLERAKTATDTAELFV